MRAAQVAAAARVLRATSGAAVAGAELAGDVAPDALAVPAPAFAPDDDARGVPAGGRGGAAAGRGGGFQASASAAVSDRTSTTSSHVAPSTVRVSASPGASISRSWPRTFVPTRACEPDAETHGIFTGERGDVPADTGDSTPS